MKSSEKNTLEALEPGEIGIITGVSNKSHAVKRRLIDMGLTPGTEIKIIKLAPLGDPMEISLRGFHLSLRKSDAGMITIGSAPPERSQQPFNSRSYIPRSYDPETLRRMARAHELEKTGREYDSTAHDSRCMCIALAGNPNSGKTTLFNALTGARQYVGNWPGVTVEKKEGAATLDGREITIADLPGIYSLSPYSMEEIVTRDCIIGGSADAIINIVDATNLERNLYLTVQLLELERPMVLALNFMDEARARGDMIDVSRLSRALGIPVVPITAKNGENLDKLLRTAHRQMHVGFTIEPDELYDDFTHEIHHRVGELIRDKAQTAKLPEHWASVKLLEGDEIVEKSLLLSEEEIASLSVIIGEYEDSSQFGDRETLIADSRYAYIERVVAAAVKKGRPKNIESASDKIDKVLTNKYLAVPLFLITMLLVFAITFGPAGSFLSDGAAFLISDCFTVWIRTGLEALLVAPWLISLICDGIIAGVGGVITFLPQIALLFFFLSFLEDSGYMSRAAFIMDRLLRRFGLSGKAFIPMLMGFGCTVPAVMGARTMENEKDRRMTILLVPFMSCSAKLPVYGLISSAFFGAKAGIVVFALYVSGMAVAVISGLLFKTSLFPGEPAPFVLEMPPYRMPSLRNTLLHVWERVRGFLIKAGTIILVMSVVLWFLQSFGKGFIMTDDNSQSILAALGNFIAPAFRPLGFGMWQAAVALLTGLIAKEAVVASLALFYGFSLTATASEAAAAMAGFSPLSALTFLIFVLLYIPCVVAVATIYKEMNSLRWTAFSVFWQIFTAYFIAMAVFQIGSLMGLG